ncbi:MAG TPA: tetratricopeptide repeat protein [Nitrospiraceae bacterium]|nr:tetratricopeptide repeat protein [Nitrospiraceae bacterium]
MLLALGRTATLSAWALAMLFSGAPSAAVVEGPTEADLEAEFSRARDLLRASPAFSGTDAQTRYRLAEELARRGDMNGAKEEYRAVIGLDPEFGEAYRGLGQVLLDYHDYAGAAEALESAVRLHRDDGEAHYWLGRALMGVGRWPEAAQAMEAAARIKPEDAEAFVDLGLLHMVQGHGVEAQAALDRAIRLKPDDAEAHRLRELLLRHQEDREQLVSAARKVLKDLFERQ